ncbi:MAG: hypothetical protein ABFD07_19145 [Methanobacterium sp.]
MSNTRDTQYGKMSKKLSNTHSDREYSGQMNKLADRDLKNMRQRK